MVTFGVVLAILLLVALLATPWAAVIAVAIAAVVGAVALLGAGFRRTVEGGDEPERARRAQEAARAHTPRGRGEPASGEGSG
jgi:hypothetical protein